MQVACLPAAPGPQVQPPRRPARVAAAPPHRHRALDRWAAPLAAAASFGSLVAGAISHTAAMVRALPRIRATDRVLWLCPGRTWARWTRLSPRHAEPQFTVCHLARSTAPPPYLRPHPPQASPHIVLQSAPPATSPSPSTAPLAPSANSATRAAATVAPARHVAGSSPSDPGAPPADPRVHVQELVWFDLPGPRATPCWCCQLRNPPSRLL